MKVKLINLYGLKKYLFAKVFEVLDENSTEYKIKYLGRYYWLPKYRFIVLTVDKDWSEDNER